MLYLRSAYGKRYNNAQDVLTDWKSGRDFYMVNHKFAYCSVRDTEYIMAEFGGAIVIIDNETVRVI